MFEPATMPTGYYRVRKGAHPSGGPHWCVARWMPTCAKRTVTADFPGWLMGDERFPPGHWDEIGAKVA